MHSYEYKEPNILANIGGFGFIAVVACFMIYGIHSCSNYSNQIISNLNNQDTTIVRTDSLNYQSLDSLLNKE